VDESIFGYRRRKMGPTRGNPLAGVRWVLNLTIEGQWYVGVGKHEPTTFSNGDLVLIPAHLEKYFGIPSTGPWAFRQCTFIPRPHWRGWMKWPDVNRGIMGISLGDSPLFDEIKTGMESVESITLLRDSEHIDLGFNALEKVLLRAYYHQIKSNPSAKADPRIEAAARYIVENLAKPLRLQDISEACHLSRAHLSALFTRQMGVSPIAFQQEYRIQRAKQLLTLTSEPVRQIAFEVGFNDPLYFSTCFRQHTGFSPTQFRQDTNK
jgi:AraC family transcriptional regulator, arabinose operon regulatory protein